jgi:hypothetical protein
MELRNTLVAEADGVILPEGSSGPDARARKDHPAGVEEHGTFTKGCPGTWEIRPFPRRHSDGGRWERLLADGRRAPRPPERSSEHSAVPRSRGTTEARREERQEVRAPR